MNNNINPNSEELKKDYVWTPAVPGQCPGAGYVLTSKKAFVEPPVGPDDMEWTQMDTPEGGVSKQYVDGKVADEKNRAEEKEADLEVNKQDLLVSGTNIKTINGQSILGEGNMDIGGGEGGDVSWGDIKGSLDNQTDLKNKFDTIKATTDAHQTSIDTLESEIDNKADVSVTNAHETRIEVLEESAGTAIEDIERLDTDKADKSVVDTLSEEVDAHKDRLNGIDQAISLQRTDIDDLKENKSKVTGVSSGDYWEKITIDGIEREIPQGGGGGGEVQYYSLTEATGTIPAADAEKLLNGKYVAIKYGNDRLYFNSDRRDESQYFMDFVGKFTNTGFTYLQLYPPYSEGGDYSYNITEKSFSVGIPIYTSVLPDDSTPTVALSVTPQEKMAILQMSVPHLYISEVNPVSGQETDRILFTIMNGKTNMTIYMAGHRRTAGGTTENYIITGSMMSGLFIMKES